MIFMQGPNFPRPKLLGAHISWEPNFLGTKNLRGPNEDGDHFSGLTHLNATPTFKNHSDLPMFNIAEKLKIPNFVRPNLWESLTSQYSHNSSALIAQPRENLSDKMLNFHPLCSLLDQTRSQHLYRIPGEYLLCSNLKLPVSKLRSIGRVKQKIANLRKT